MPLTSQLRTSEHQTSFNFKRWRELLSDSDFDWTDFHLHRFRIHKRDYAVPRFSGLDCADEARQVKFADLHFRINERFLYEYDFNASWQHQVRMDLLQIGTSLTRRARYTIHGMGQCRSSRADQTGL